MRKALGRLQRAAVTIATAWVGGEGGGRAICLQRVLSGCWALRFDVSFCHVQRSRQLPNGVVDTFVKSR